MADSAITPELVLQGRVAAVVDRLPGASLIVDAGVGAGELELDNVYDFNELGGTGTISDGVNSEPITYTALDDDLATLTLSGVLTNSYLADDATFVTAYSGGLEKSALVIRDDVDDEQILVRIPHRWYDVMPEGVRDPGEGEAITARFDGVDWLLEDILGQTPSSDGQFIDPATLPPPTMTDGDPPATSPTPVVSGGIGTIFVTWVAITNADAVTYEVHISTSSGFTPGPTTKAAETGGTLIALHALPDTTPLDYATTYYVKLIAVDADGSAAASTEDSGSPVQVDTPDIAVNAITADKILANAITAEKLEAVLALVSTLVAGTVDAARVELGVDPDDPSDIGVRAFDSAGAATARIDGQDGSVYIRGRLDFGQGSRLLANDIVELHKQEITGVQTPERVQRAGKGKHGSGVDIDNIGVAWPAPTVEGSLLLAVVAQNNSGGGGTPRTPVISGWTQVQTQARGGGPIQRQTIFKIEGGASRSGIESIDFTSGGSSNTRYAVVEIIEYSGTDDQDVLVAATTGTDFSVEFGSTGTLAQAGEVELACVSMQEDGIVDVPSGWTGGYTHIAQNVATDGLGNVKCACAIADRITTDTADGTTSAQLTGSGTAWIASIVTFRARAAGALPPGDADILRIYTEDDTGGPLLHVQDSDGDTNSVAMAPAGVGWRMEVLTANVDLASLGAASGATINVTLTGVQSGDIVVWIGTDVTGDGRQFIHYVDPASVTTNQITLIYFNADDATRNASTATHYFLVIHRS